MLLPFAGDEPEDLLAQLAARQGPEDLLRQPDGPAQVEPLVVVPVEVSFPSLRVVEEAVGVEALVAMVVVAGPVEVAAAPLGDDLDVAARGAPILGLIVGGQNLELGNVVENECDVLGPVRAGIDVGRPIDRQVVLIAPGTIDVEGTQPPWAGGLPIDEADHAGGQLDKVEVVASIEREVLDLLAVDDLALFAALRLEKQTRSIGGDLDDISDRTNLQRDDPGRLPVVDIDDDAGLDRFLESGGVDCHRVVARLQRGERKGAL